MITTTIFPNRYIQGKDSRKQLGRELTRLGRRGVALCDPFVFDTMLAQFEPYLTEVDITLLRFAGECCEEEIERLVAKVKESGGEFIVGIGGGKTQDTAKATAFYAELPVAIVPTHAASDSPCSAVSVIYTPTGQLKHYLKLRTNPDLVLMDTQIVAQAPARFLAAGMGDALSTWLEAESCQRSGAPTQSGNPGSFAAFGLARLCYDTLLQYGVQAKADNTSQTVTLALERIVEANTLLSGIGFESGGLAAAHAIHNGLTTLDATAPYLHGEKVAFGVLTSLFLTEKPAEQIEELFHFCEQIGLPTTLAAIGLEQTSEQELMTAIQASCDKESSIHNETIAITPEKLLQAMRSADAEGKRRQSRKG